MCYDDMDERDVFRISKELFVEASAIGAEADSLGLDPRFCLAQIRLEEATLCGNEERRNFLLDVLHVMKTIEFSGFDTLYIFSRWKAFIRAPRRLRLALAATVERSDHLSEMFRVAG